MSSLAGYSIQVSRNTVVSSVTLHRTIIHFSEYSGFPIRHSLAEVRVQNPSANQPEKAIEKVSISFTADTVNSRRSAQCEVSEFLFIDPVPVT